MEKVPDADPVPCIQTTFSTEYGILEGDEINWRHYQCTFDIIDFKVSLFHTHFRKHLFLHRSTYQRLLGCSN